MKAKPGGTPKNDTNTSCTVTKIPKPPSTASKIFTKVFAVPARTRALDFSETDLQQMAKEENETIDTNEEEIDVIDGDQEIETTRNETLEDLTKDPFIAKMASLPNNPLDIPTCQWPSITTRDDALLAIRQLPSKTGYSFTIPGRASLGFSMSESNSTTEHSEIDTQLDRPLGIQLYPNSRIQTK